MKVLIRENKNLKSEDFCEFNYIKTQFESLKEYMVYGIFFKENKLYYLLCNNDVPFINFYKSSCFEVSDSRCSSLWFFSDVISHEFDMFDGGVLLGPQRLLSEKDFYRKYLEYDDKEAFNYMLAYKLASDYEFKVEF